MNISPKIETWSGNKAIGETSMMSIMPIRKSRMVNSTIPNMARRKVVFADTDFLVGVVVVVIYYSPILLLDLSPLYA